MDCPSCGAAVERPRPALLREVRHRLAPVEPPRPMDRTDRITGPLFADDVPPPPAPLPPRLAAAGRAQPPGRGYGRCSAADVVRRPPDQSSRGLRSCSWPSPRSSPR